MDKRVCRPRKEKFKHGFQRLATQADLHLARDHLARHI